MSIPEHEPVKPTPPDESPPTWDADDEVGEDEIPSAVLYVIAALLVLAFTLYIVVGGGHNHFH